MGSFERSAEVMASSADCFPGGVNSPVRSFYAVGGTPLVFSHGKGKTLYDIDGQSYIDFCASWGPLILGHGDPYVVSKIQAQAERALSFGSPSELELQLAHKIKEFVPQIEMLRLVSSGTEATMSAIRLARGYTGRKKFIKFEGCYHGHSNELLIAAGSGLATLGLPASGGVTQGAVEDTISIPYNDLEKLEEAFKRYQNDLACVILEPMTGNMGLVIPSMEYMQRLRQLTKDSGALLIFDEVITGFRLAKGGAAEVFHIVPDIWAFGKILGGGLPAAAYASSKQIMSAMAPLGSVYQAGTLSGNPLAMAAGLATLERIESLNLYEKLEKLGQYLDACVKKHLEGKNLCYLRKASMFCFFFGTKTPPKNFTEVKACDMTLFSKVYHILIDNGLYLGPSGYEVSFLSACHEPEDIEKLVLTIASALDA